MTEQTSDVLWGAAGIAAFLNIPVGRAEYLIEARKIPFFKLGRTVCARRTTLLAAFERLEQQAS